MTVPTPFATTHHALPTTHSSSVEVIVSHDAADQARFACDRPNNGNSRHKAACLGDCGKTRGASDLAESVVFAGRRKTTPAAIFISVLRRAVLSVSIPPRADLCLEARLPHFPVPGPSSPVPSMLDRQSTAQISAARKPPADTSAFATSPLCAGTAPRAGTVRGARV
jgi:hypothetical protein